VSWFTNVRYSTFSPEDNYSNLAGAIIGASAVRTPRSETIPDYDAAVDTYLRSFVTRAEGQSRAIALEAIQSVTGLWFAPNSDVGAALTGNSPEYQNILWRRHVVPLPAVTPWLVTDLDGLTFSYVDPVAGTVTPTIDFNLGTPKPSPLVIEVPDTTVSGLR